MYIKLFVDVAQVVTAVATLFALFALLLQVRLLKSQLLTSNQLTVMKDERDIWQMAVENPEAREGLVREVFGGDNPTNSPSENMVASMLFDHYEKIFFQHRRGAFPEELWPSWEIHIAKTVAQPKLFACWEDTKQTFWVEFVGYFDPKIHKAANDRNTAT
jgi:hypothetical protein